MLHIVINKKNAISITKVLTEMSSVNQEEVKLKVSSKKHLWDAVKRNQKFIPDFKCKCITIEYLEGVRDGTYWAPNYD